MKPWSTRMRRRRAWLLVVFFLLTGRLSITLQAGEEAIDYLRDVKPLLAKHCTTCHGSRTQESGLRLDTAVDLRAGGDSGPSIVPGKAVESRLIHAVEATGGVSRMPPEDRPALKPDEIKVLRRWIDAGAAAPATEERPTVETKHWAFQAPVATVPPLLIQRSWARSPIDLFILKRLAAIEGKKNEEGDQANGKSPGAATTANASATRASLPLSSSPLGAAPLAPSPLAAAATQLRRLRLDLTGLPPTVDELTEFLADEAPDAYERALDRTLARPSFGERFGRHWLDQARYADSNGYTRDFGREIWPYRDWVLRAINQDLPFNQFTIEQLAGDLLPEPTNAQLVATGFHRNTLINEEGGTDQEQFRVEAVADRVATTGQVWLGLTLGCARCHNHKYDPISQREFYQFFAFLNDCDEPTIEAPTQLNLERKDLETRDQVRGQIAALDRQIEARRSELEQQQAAWEKTVTPQQRARLPGPIQIAYDMPVEKRDAQNKKTLEDYYRQTEHARQAFPLLDEIARLREREPKIPQTLVLRRRAEPRVTQVHKRGDFLNLGVVVQPGVPAVLPSLPTNVASRLELARWLVDDRNPLTARVIVNRYWQTLFGRGLVETDDDFGLQGTPPTHPELLDWLARQFQQPDRAAWSTKRWLRDVLSSAVYRQSSDARPDLAELDPRNELLARQNRLRVEAEIVRDLALGASGLLTSVVGGPSVMPPQPEGVYAFTQDPKPWKTETGANRYRRGMYTFFWRSLPHPMLTVFDAPNANVSCTKRLRSNTPLQALTLANDVMFVECARSLSERLLAESSVSVRERIQHLVRLTLSRDPTAEEMNYLVTLVESQRQAFAAEPALADEFLREMSTTESDAGHAAQGNLGSDQKNADDKVGKSDDGKRAKGGERDAERAAWMAVARVLLNLDEFITRE